MLQDNDSSMIRSPNDPARPLRVLMVVESSAGGTGRHVLDLSQGLIARGCEVHLLYSTRRIDKMFLDRFAGISGLHHQALPMRTVPNPGDLAVVWKARRYAKQHGPFDVIHGHSSKGGAIARLAALGSGAAAFYTLHGLIMMDPGLAWWKRTMYLGIEVLLSWMTSRIIAVSPEEGRAAVKLGLGAPRVALVPNGIGPQRLAPREQARRRMGVAHEAVVVGFVGRLVEQKAPHVLIQAFARTAKAFSHSRLALVGAGPLEAELKAQASALGVGEKLIWLGERDAREVLAGFDLFALSSRKEGLPYVVIEAMAAGLPVVATSSSGVEILVEDGANGSVVPPDDAGRFGDALLRLVSDRSQRERMSQVSGQRAARFTIDAMVNQTLACYRGGLMGSACEGLSPPLARMEVS